MEGCQQAFRITALDGASFQARLRSVRRSGRTDHQAGGEGAMFE